MATNAYLSKYVAIWKSWMGGVYGASSLPRKCALSPAVFSCLRLRNSVQADGLRQKNMTDQGGKSRQLTNCCAAALMAPIIFLTSIKVRN
jgi:hypothetical protein